jgi:hypothetical protein
MAWSDLIKGRLFVHRVPGGHVGMLQDEGSSQIAETLRSLLDQVDAERNQMVVSLLSKLENAQVGLGAGSEYIIT